MARLDVTGKSNKMPNYSERGSAGTGKTKIIHDYHSIQRDNSSKEERSSRGLGVQALTFTFYIAFLVLFVVAFYRYTAGMPLPTFTGLLNFIQTCPNVTLHPHIIGSIEADWGIFNFFRDFINTLTTIFGVGMYACSSIAQVILLLGWFLAWAFAIV